KDVSWIKSDGSEFGEEDWDDPGLRTIGMHLAGDEPGNGHQPSPVLLVFHAGEDEIEFMLPSMKRKGSRDGWRALVSTDSGDGSVELTAAAGDCVTVPGRTVMMFVPAGMDDGR